ncbi:MAG: ACP S-malonyltransferase [Balneolaceae bacterium]|nr:ACP S-malonyltransferase [Balneolaceae bacterium]
MMKAFIFPGQGSQKVGMGKDHFEQKVPFKEFLTKGDELLGYPVSDIMFEGPAETLTQTQYTQPAIFLHSFALFKTLGQKPDMVAGHSLGEFTALASADVLDFEKALELVSLRGKLMQNAGEVHTGTMAAIIGMDDDVVDEICEIATESIQKPVVPANYNCPGQLVISGDEDAVKKAVELAKEKGCRLAKMLPVSGAFHSPLMKPAFDALQVKLDETEFSEPTCPVYSNYTAEATTDPSEIKHNLLYQLINPVRWTQTLLNMEKDGATSFIEVGPGKVLQGLVKRTLKNANIEGYE